MYNLNILLSLSSFFIDSISFFNKLSIDLEINPLERPENSTISFAVLYSKFSCKKTNISNSLCVNPKSFNVGEINFLYVFFALVKETKKAFPLGLRAFKSINLPP